MSLGLASRVGRTGAAVVVATLLLSLTACVIDEHALPDDHPAVVAVEAWASHLGAGEFAAADALAVPRLRTDAQIVAAAEAADAQHPQPSPDLALRVTDISANQYDTKTVAFVSVYYELGGDRTGEKVTVVLDAESGAWQVEHALPAIGVAGFTADELWLDGAPGHAVTTASTLAPAVIARPGAHTLTIESDHPALDPSTSFEVVMGLTRLEPWAVRPTVSDETASAVATLLAELSETCATACEAGEDESGTITLVPLAASATDPNLITAPASTIATSFTDRTTGAPLRVEAIELIPESRNDLRVTLANGGQGWNSLVACGPLASCDHDPHDDSGVPITELTVTWDGSHWQLSRIGKR